MAYTKAQREAKEAEKKAKLQEQVEAEMRAELEEKIRKEFEEKAKTSTASTTNKIPLTITVPVECNVVGSLYYAPRNGGIPVEWDGLGSIEYMELSALVTMRNTNRRFYEDNWIVLRDTDDYTAEQLYDFLKVSKYYKNSFTPDTIDSIFDMDAKSIIKTVTGLSKGVRDTLATRAKTKIDSGELDSKSKIEALEKALNVTFSI